MRSPFVEDVSDDRVNLDNDEAQRKPYATIERLGSAEKREAIDVG